MENRQSEIRVDDERSRVEDIRRLIEGSERRVGEFLRIYRRERSSISLSDANDFPASVRKLEEYVSKGDE